MKEIYAIVRKDKAVEVGRALADAEIAHLSWNVKGRGKEGGLRYKGTDTGFTFMPKTIFWSTAENGETEKVLKVIMGSAATGNYGDGKIFVMSGGSDETY